MKTYVLILLAWSSLASAQDHSMLEALSHGRDTGRLPSWISLDDDWAVKWGNGRAYGCFKDRATGALGAGWAPTATLQRFAVTGSWQHTDAVVPRAEVEQFCWPELAPPPGPRAIGEPAYWTLTWKAGPVTVNTIDFTTTNLPANIAGTTVAGESCGLPAKTLGYYTLPRLQSGGRTPLVRCE